MPQTVSSIPFWRKTILVRSVSATPYLLSLLTYVEGRVAEIAGGYSPARWLWYLRRLPHFMFEGSQATTRVYDTALAEVASGRFGGKIDNLRIYGQFASYPTEGAAVTRVLRFCSAIRLMSQIHILLRYAGKGVRFRFLKGDPFPVPIPTVDEEAVIKLYDSRNSASNRVSFEAAQA